MFDKEEKKRKDSCSEIDIMINFFLINMKKTLYNIILIRGKMLF